MNQTIRSRTIVAIFSLLSITIFGACAATAGMDAAVESPYPAREAVTYDIAAVEEAAYESAESDETAATADRKIVGTANIDLVVEDSNTAVDDITTLIKQAGGYVADSNFYHIEFGDDTALQGNMTLRVPAEVMDLVLKQLEALALTVSSQSLTRDDVTDQFTDLDARLRNLEATEVELLQLLSEVRAKPEAKSEDILAIHRNLMEIRGQIEQVQGHKTMLDNLIALSTIHLSLRPDTNALPIVDEGWHPNHTVENALRTLIRTVQALGDAAIWLVLFALPIFLILMLPLVILVWLVVIVVRRVRKRREA